MNYGVIAVAVLGAAALAMPKGPDHNLMKLPSFRGVVEVRASIPGRMRLYMPSLAANMEQAQQMKAQLEGTGVVHQVALEPVTGSVLICYDELRVEAAVIEGAAMKLMGLDAQLSSAPKSRMEEGLQTIKSAVNRSVMDATNGMMDGRMLAGTALTVVAAKSFYQSGLAVPGAMTLFWWAGRLLGGSRA